MRYIVEIIPEQARVIDTHDHTHSPNGKAIYQGWTKDAKDWAQMLEAQCKETPFLEKYFGSRPA